MCVTPTILHKANHFYPGSEPVLIPCRVCWQCVLNKVQEWTGRNLAEAQTSTVSYAVTFTYGRDWDGRADHIQSVQLMYSDIQKLLKRMRKKGYDPRYIIAGEYGASLQRAHWHGVFHFQGDCLPDHWDGEHLSWSQDQWDKVGGIHIPEWSIYDVPIGTVHIKKATYAHVKYALKYLQKDQNDPFKQNVFHMSRFPPLGSAYMVELARDTAMQGLAIQDMKYFFNVRNRSGEEKRESFLLRGRLAEIYLETYVSSWKHYHGSTPVPASDVVATFMRYGKLGNADSLHDLDQEERIKDERFAKRYPASAPYKTGSQISVKEWWAQRDELFRQEKQKRLERKKRNGKEYKQRQKRGELTALSLAIDTACARAGITRAQYNSLPAAWRAFVRHSPTDCQSLWRANLQDFHRYNPGAKPGHLWG